MTLAIKIKDMTPEQKREYMRAAHKRHYLKKRDECIERAKKYYAENKDKMLSKSHEYYWDHRDEYCENACIRRELRKMAAE